MPDYRLPTSSDRTLFVGRTGSGKTVAACWCLSQSNFRSAPWLVFNHKNTRLIDSIEGAEFVDLDYLPKKPGIYIYHPIPDVDDDAVTRLLWHVYQRGNMGVYYDEGMMINPRDPANKALLTQGREKRIPMITASQRPVGLARNVITEADFIQSFQLTDDDDIKRIREIVPFDMREYMKTRANEAPKLGEYYSLWYDVKRNVLLRISPVEGGEERILSDFRNALKPAEKRRRIFL
jgi:hypothetical protein